MNISRRLIEEIQKKCDSIHRDISGKPDFLIKSRFPLAFSFIVQEPKSVATLENTFALPK